jgi:hypothetical protein
MRATRVREMVPPLLVMGRTGVSSYNLADVPASAGELPRLFSPQSQVSPILQGSDTTTITADSAVHVIGRGGVFNSKGSRR